MHTMTRKLGRLSTWCKHRAFASSLRQANFRQKAYTYSPVSGVIVDVICAGGKGGSKSVLISASDGQIRKKYLFNCGEGTQRYIHERFKGRNFEQMKQVRDIFITHNSWNNVGGLTAFVLAITEELLKSQKLRLHAPPYLETALYTNNLFQWNLGSMSIQKGDNKFVTFDKRSYDRSPYSDKLFAIDYVPLSRNRSITSKTAASFDTAVAYILHSVGKIKSNGATGPIVVLECPSVEYLPGLQTLGDRAVHNNSQPEIFIHMSPADVVAHPDYQHFMQKYGSTSKHMLLNENSQGPYAGNSIQFQYLMNYLNPHIFPELKMLARERLIWCAEGISCGHAGSYYKCFFKNKKLQIRTTIVLFNDHLENLRFLHDVLRDSMKCLTEKLEEHQKSQQGKEVRPYPEVVFLGTASSIPQCNRNISCILVRTCADACMLLDCGESSLSQLLHVYGYMTDKILCQLEAIFVSHIHLDHHGGLVGIVNARKIALENKGLVYTKLLLLVPYQLQAIFKRYSRLQPDLDENIHVQPHEYMQDRNSEVSPFMVACAKLQLVKCKPVPVVHTCKSAHGLVLEGLDGWKLVYSGDTAPCMQLVREGKDCDLLIHEATFDDTNKETAQANLHSTTTDAIKIGQQMGSKFTILTHFSSRQQHISQIMVKELPGNVGVAFDFMTVRLDPSELRTIRWHHDALCGYLRCLRLGDNLYRYWQLDRGLGGLVSPKRLSEPEELLYGNLQQGYAKDDF